MMRDGVFVRVFAGLAFGFGMLVSAQSSSSIRIVSLLVPASSISSIPASSVSQFQSSPTRKIQSVVSSQTPLSTIPSPTSTSQAPANPSGSSTSALPACALTCQDLTKAHSACRANTPLANLQTNATLYRDCFCHSPAYLSLQSSTPNICTTSCPSPLDISKTRTFYQNFCNEDEPTNTTVTSPPPAAGQATNTTNTTTPQPTRPRLSKTSTISIAIGASIALLLLCALAYYPVFTASRRATARSRSPSLAGSHHRRGSDHRRGSVSSNSASKPQTGDTSLRSGMETDEEAGVGAPVAEIARSPGKGRSRQGSGEEGLPSPGSPRAKEMVHVISVAAFKE